MNNAANNIDATSKNLRELLKERRYKVGYFQREYKWQKVHIEDLLDDLERSFFSNYMVEHTQEQVADYDCYYMGPIVLFKEGSSFSIVDGQQRLTSFTLLIIYLNHIQKIIYSKTPKKIQKLEEYVYSQYFGRETFNLDIPERETILGKLFNNIEILDEDIASESADNILERFKDIEELFPSRLKHEEVLALFINWLTEKLRFVEIVSQTSEKAYTIFETMNDRGLNLTPTEMLKSFLLASVNDDDKIKELDSIWKNKIGSLKSYSYDEDQDFFRALLRAKYAETIRISQSGSENEDFEKIGTRFHTWVKENTRKLFLKRPEDFYFFVQSDIQFYCELYIRLSDLETNELLPEHEFKLLSYKGVSNSLSYPFVLAPIQKTDEIEIIDEKIRLCVKYLDAFGIYRLLLGFPITQSSIRNGIYNMIREIRNFSPDKLKSYLSDNLKELRSQFLKNITYLPFDRTFAKYLLSRLYKNKYENILFENLYFQRRRDSFSLYQFFSFEDSDSEVQVIPSKLKEIFIANLCSYCIVPREKLHEFIALPLIKRIKKLISENYMTGIMELADFDQNNLKEFFIKRNKNLKELIFNSWKL
jgi:uncharacterized protein with ParB-like and HNH nuclease domain